MEVSDRSSNRLFLRLFAMLAVFALATGNTLSATWYVASNGLDTNAGTSNAPFATIMRAQSAATAGDTVYLRGGTYYLTTTNISATNQPWKVVNDINKSGVSYIAYPGELPVFDFSAVSPDPPTNRVTAFQVSASGCVFKGFDVVGVPIVITNAGTQSECFRVNGGSMNRFEQLRMHDGHGIGFYLTDGASNLVLNCDAFNNWGINANSAGNIDGFGFHSGHMTSVSNVIRGCRAWFNSDDGYDLINNDAAVLIDHCWAFYNGYSNYTFTPTGGNANGFKSGGYGVSGGSYPKPVPRNTVQFCLSVRNGGIGIYANHHPDGLNFIGNTAYTNHNTDYNMVCNTNNVSSTNDCPGFNHYMRNNLGFRGNKAEVTNLDMGRSDVAFNFFSLSVTVSSNDFMSLDESLLTLPRATDGSLPYIGFAQLVSTSDLVDAGTNVGFAYAGAAPDLGAFEYGSTVPTLAMSRAGTNVVFTGGTGPAGGTDYLIATTNLSLPTPQWPRLATNKFDLTGSCAITNGISPGEPQRFFRISLP
jgi:pectate lyase